MPGPKYKIHVWKHRNTWYTMLSLRDGYYVKELCRKDQPDWETAIEFGYQALEQYIFDPMSFA